VPQLIDGRVCRNDNIAVAQVCGAENAVARGVPGPALPNEALNLGNLPLRAYADQVLADGAVAYWRLDEISGLTARDSIGGNNGTISGGVTLNQPGALAGDSAMVFDGVNSRIIVPNGPAISGIGLGPLTIELWLRETTVPSDTRVLVDIVGTATSNAGFMVFRQGTPHVYFGVKDPVSGNIVQATFVGLGADGGWHHVVAVLTRGTPDSLAVYLDGSIGNTAAGGTNVNYAQTGNLNVASSVAGIQNFAGGLDEIAIYHTALSPAQILAHYQAGVMVTENIRVGVPGPNPEVP
jgi:hypothetical protein